MCTHISVCVCVEYQGKKKKKSTSVVENPGDALYLLSGQPLKVRSWT